MALITRILIVLAALALACAGCAGGPQLQFSTAPCDEGIDPYKPPKVGILKQEWVAADTLSVEAFVKTYCDGVTITGAYRLEGDALQLVVRQKVGTASRCNCAHKLTYRISPLPQREYQVTIAQE